VPEHRHRGHAQEPPRLAGTPAPGCASLTRATRLTGATRLHVARIRPKAASGSHAYPSRRGRRDPPEHGHRGHAQGPPRLAGEPGPGCASLTRATRLTGATRLHVARIRPKAASG